MNKILKYPRTAHIKGSNPSIGDLKKKFPFKVLEGRNLAVEEKVDGSNSGISFSSDAEMLLQSRGHYLAGKTYSESHFNQFKNMMRNESMKSDLFDLLEDRYILYGEYLYAKHTIFYDLLPSSFMEFDIYDKKEKVFLDTERRWQMLSQFRPNLQSVRVLYRGKIATYEDLIGFVGKSLFVSDNCHENFLKSLKNSKAKYDVEIKQTDLSGIMEGLYIKVEEDGIVKERYKWVRGNFTQRVIDSEKHWKDHPLVRNRYEKE